MNHIFGFIGFTEIHEIFVEPTLAGLEAKAEAVAAALRTAKDLVLKM